jgi:peptidoglycan hydrolase CwlO-like protein
MGKKLDKLVGRIQALEKAIAAMVTGKKAKKSVKKKSAKAKTAKAAPKKPKKKAAAKKPAPKRRARKAKPMTPPLPLAATL